MFRDAPPDVAMAPAGATQGDRSSGVTPMLHPPSVSHQRSMGPVCLPTEAAETDRSACLPHQRLSSV
jgi:hypothetical protein